ncbi:probable 26S proteasome regulatory subunit p28 [Trichomonascus vanleenenianus]|uniref:Nas6p n=1 Tax=Trichomonascus vanleenenianus TaxID=2268995 RepID=UPI003ECA8DDD
MEPQIEGYPLHDAARDNKPLLVKKILADMPSIANKKDDDGRTALFWAVSYSNNEAASEILKVAKTQRSFDIDETDEAGWTVLHIAASVGNLEVIDQLLMPLDPAIDAQTNSGQTALHFAVSKQHIDVVRYLLEHKASSRVRDKQEQNPLHRAASVGSVPITKLLIEYKAPLNASDRDGWTALHHAMAEGNGDVAVALIAAGAETDRQDKEGHTAFDVAVDDKVLKYVKHAISSTH